jgi:hypothetical protein
MLDWRDLLPSLRVIYLDDLSASNQLERMTICGYAWNNLLAWYHIQSEKHIKEISIIDFS